jgi:hypothetical protein
MNQLCSSDGWPISSNDSQVITTDSLSSDLGGGGDIVSDDQYFPQSTLLLHPSSPLGLSSAADERPTREGDDVAGGTASMSEAAREEDIWVQERQ